MMGLNCQENRRVVLKTALVSVYTKVIYCNPNVENSVLHFLPPPLEMIYSPSVKKTCYSTRLLCYTFFSYQQFTSQYAALLYCSPFYISKRLSTRPKLHICQTENSGTRSFTFRFGQTKDFHLR